MNPESARQSSHDAGQDKVIPERRYRKPPVVEALCEIFFSDSAWDDTVPGAFFERVKNDFPKKQQREIQQAEIALGPAEAKAGIRRLPPWLQFVSDEKRRMIQVAKDLLVVNQLSPYPHFEEWEPEVLRALDIYRQLAGPLTVQRIGLRYINRVTIPQAQIKMEDYFTVFPNLPRGLGGIHGSFLVRVEVPQGDSGHTVLITFGTVPQPRPDAQTFTLDLYDILHCNKPFEEIDFEKEVGRAHGNIVLAFEDSVKDRLRDLFEPMEERQS